MRLHPRLGFLGYYGIKRDISERLQKQVDQSLDGVSLFYDEEIRRIGVSLDIANLNEEMSVLGEKMHLHYFYRLSAEQALKHPSEIVRQSAHSGQAVSGTRIIESDELATMSQDVRQRATIVIQPTAMAMPTERKVLDVAMAKEYALPLNDATGAVSEVLCGGRVVNQDSEFVDRIRQLVFGDEEYHAKPVGTVTVFLGDVRVSTNVLDKNGQRAIGTRISEEVYRKVFEQGLRWRDRALVVGHWYKAAYKPIYNINNATLSACCMWAFWSRRFRTRPPRCCWRFGR